MTWLLQEHVYMCRLNRHMHKQYAIIVVMVVIMITKTVNRMLV